MISSYLGITGLKCGKQLNIRRHFENISTILKLSTSNTFNTLFFRLTKFVFDVSVDLSKPVVPFRLTFVAWIDLI